MLDHTLPLPNCSISSHCGSPVFWLFDQLSHYQQNQGIYTSKLPNVDHMKLCRCSHLREFIFKEEQLDMDIYFQRRKATLKHLKIKIPSYVYSMQCSALLSIQNH